MSTNSCDKTFSTSCKKCGGRSVHAATIPKSDESSAYEVYQCVDCNAHEWVSQKSVQQSK